MKKKTNIGLLENDNLENLREKVRRKGVYDTGDELAELGADLIEVPISRQNYYKRFSFREREPGKRVYIGIDTETTQDLGQKFRSLQIAKRAGPHLWEANYIEDAPGCSSCGKTKVYEIQGERVEVTKRQIPQELWGQLTNNLLEDPKVTLSFFNLLFDIPGLYQVSPARNERLSDYWFFYTNQPVFAKRLPDRRVMLLQSKYQFLDTQTLAGIVRGTRSLAEASKEILGFEKLEFNPESVKYAVWDAVLTAMLAEKLDLQLKKMQMKIRPDLVRSPASFSKYLLGAMEVRRPEFLEETIAHHWRAYFGGKIETNPAYTKTPITGDLVYSDISGQYAQAMNDTGVFRFMTCKRIILKTISNPNQDKLLKPDPKNAHIAVKVRIKNGIVPVKTKTVNLFAQVTGTDVYMLADIWALKLLTPGAKVEILEAYEPVPEGSQDLTISHKLDPYNVPSSLIQRRKTAKNAHLNEFYKNTLNTLYGISAEGQSQNYDNMGVYGNPIIASTITSYARYLVAIGENYIKNQGGEVYYIHTDSLFIDNEFYPGLKEYYKKFGVKLDVKGRGKSFMTISAGKYALFKDKKGQTPAEDKHGDLLVSFHGLTRPIKITHPEKSFFDLMVENWSEAYKCYSEGQDPLNWKGFKGLDYKLIESINVQSVFTYKRIKKEFENAGLDPDIVRCGMFFYIGREADDTKIVTPSIELADQHGTQTLNFMIRKHFNTNDKKHNYAKKRNWKINIDKERTRTKRQDYIESDID